MAWRDDVWWFCVLAPEAPSRVPGHAVAISVFGARAKCGLRNHRLFPCLLKSLALALRDAVYDLASSRRVLRGGAEQIVERLLNLLMTC